MGAWPKGEGGGADAAGGNRAACARVWGGWPYVTPGRKGGGTGLPAQHLWLGGEWVAGLLSFPIC